MNGLTWPLFRAHARGNLALFVTTAVCLAIVSGAVNVLLAAARLRSETDSLAAADVQESDLGSVATTLMGLTLTITIFTGVFLVASMTAFTVDSRVPEIARLRLLGCTPRQLSRSIIREVTWVGAAAGLVAAVAGWPAGLAMRTLLVAADFAPAGIDVPAHPAGSAIVFAVGVLVAVVGTWSVARRAGRTDPMVAVTTIVPARRAMTASRWATIGLGAIALGGLAYARPDTADDQLAQIMGLLLGTLVILAAAAPVLIPAVVSLVGRPLTRIWPGPGRIAVEHTRFAARRTGALALPVMLVVGLGGGLLTTLLTANRVDQSGSAVDLVVTGVLDDSAVEDARDLPGAESVTGLTSLAVETTADQEHRERSFLTAVDLAAAVEAGLVTVVDSSAAPDEHRVVSPGHEPFLLGAVLTALPPGVDPVALPVTGLVDVGPLLKGADAFVDRTITRTWGAHDLDTLLVTVSEGYDVDGVRARLSELLAPATVTTADETLAARAQDRNARNMRAVGALLGGGAVMAICSILVGGLSGSADRRSELTVLARSGATRRQILGSVVLETVLVLAVAAILVAAAVAVVVVRLDSLDSAGGPPDIRAGLIVSMFAGVSLLALASTVGGTAWQIRRNLRSASGSSR